MPHDPFDVCTLERMNIAELRSAWAHHLGEAPPPLRAPELLRRELAWRLEARTYGELDAKLRQQLDRLGRQPAKRSKVRGPSAATPVGSTLMREWDGVQYKVVVLKDGYSFEGETFRSLSHIARKITGVRWSGPRFFGLRERDR